MVGTRGRPRKSEARDTRRLILDAALDVFARLGFQGATIRQVAKQVGIRESSIYAHFTGKNDILKAIIESHGPFQPLTRLRTVSGDDVARDPAGVMRRIGAAIGELWSQETNLKFVRLITMEQLSGSKTIPPEVRGQYEDIASTFASLFRVMLERGIIKGFEPDDLVAEYLGAIMHIRHHDVLMNPEPDLRRLRERIVHHTEYFVRRLGLG